MDLKDILEKNKHKVSRLPNLKMPSVTTVAIEDRPYNIDFDNGVETLQNHDENVRNKGLIINEIKEVTKRKQTGNFSGDKRVTNKKQTGNNIPVMAEVLQGISKQKGNNSTTKQVTNFKEKRKQTSNIFTEKLPLEQLVGTQRATILFFYLLAKKNQSQKTNPVTLEHISKSLNIEKNVLKTTIIRLQKKGCIGRHEGKTGRGGWSCFTVSNHLYQEIMQHERQGFLDKELVNTGNNLVTKEVTERVTFVPSSSSIYNKTTTTDIEDDEANNFTFNIVPLSNIGLTNAHIGQLTKQQKLTPDQIQDSIYYFAFDLTRNEKAKTLKKGPLDFFMGILRQGIPYTPPNNYESPETESMRLYLESKAKTKKNNEELEKELKENIWQEWKESLSDQELMEFYVPGESLDSVPEKVRTTLKKRNAISNAQQYFESEIWQSKRKEILENKVNA